MKIAVMSIGDSKESLISDKFGRAPFIIICDTDKNLYEVIENSGIQSKHGAGAETAELIIENGIDLLLTKEIGVKAYSVLAKAHIAIQLLTSESTVKGSIKHYLKNNQGNKIVHTS